MSEIRPSLTPEETDKIKLPSGISLREYLAGQALAGMLANCFDGIYHPFEKTAVEYADKLITELNRPTPTPLTRDEIISELNRTKQ